MPREHATGGAVRIPAIEDAALEARVVAEHALLGVTAGSALLKIGARLLAVHDDAFRVSWIDPATFGVTPLVLAGDGAALAKSVKPDFESAARTSDGAIHLLGSGSTRAALRDRANRSDRGNRRAVGAPGSLSMHVQDALGLGVRPNIEGAVIGCGRLRLFHRGVGGAPSGCVDLRVDVLDGAAPHRVGAVCTFELGALDGVSLGITDAVAARGEECMFVAAAEDTADAIADGAVVGLGARAHRLDRGARWTRLVDVDGRPYRGKVEGLVVDESFGGGWILTDADDPEQPTTIGRIELKGFDGLAPVLANVAFDARDGYSSGPHERRTTDSL